MLDGCSIAYSPITVIICLLCDPITSRFFVITIKSVSTRTLGRILIIVRFTASRLVLYRFCFLLNLMLFSSDARYGLLSWNKLLTKPLIGPIVVQPIWWLLQSIVIHNLCRKRGPAYFPCGFPALTARDSWIEVATSWCALFLLLTVPLLSWATHGETTFAQIVAQSSSSSHHSSRIPSALLVQRTQAAPQTFQ